MRTETSASERAYKSPLPKLVAFFRNSRDRWKAKYLEPKRLFRKERNQVRAVEKSRAAWRDRAQSAHRRIEELERELAETKKPSRAPLAFR